MKRINLLVTAVVVASISMPCLASKQAESYSQFRKKADADMSSASGKKFDEKFIASIGQKLAAGLGKCVKPESPGFDAIILVSSEGTAQSLVFNIDDHLTRCIGKELKGVQGEKPPFAPFHVLLEMKIKE